jgi:hypothetical protein
MVFTRPPEQFKGSVVQSGTAEVWVLQRMHACESRSLKIDIVVASNKYLGKD